MIYSLFITINPSATYFGQQLLFKRKYCRVVPIHSHLYWNLKREVSRSDKEFKIVIIFRWCSRKDSLFQAFYYLNAWNGLQRRKKWICESRCQVGDHLHFLWNILIETRTLPRIQFMLGLHFTLSLAFYPQSAVCSLRFTLTGFPSMQYLPSFINVLINFFLFHSKWWQFLLLQFW